MTVRKFIDDLGGRKFTIAAFFSLVDAVGLFTDKLSGTEFLSLAGLILGLYGVANVAQKRILRDEPVALETLRPGPGQPDGSPR